MSKKLEDLTAKEIKDVLSNCYLMKTLPKEVILEFIGFCYYPKSSDLIRMHPTLITNQTYISDNFPWGWFEPLNNLCKKISQEFQPQINLNINIVSINCYKPLSSIKIRFRNFYAVPNSDLNAVYDSLQQDAKNTCQRCGYYNNNNNNKSVNKITPVMGIMNRDEWLLE
eukprot:327949_1